LLFPVGGAPPTSRPEHSEGFEGRIASLRA
jgi:hypothetical protein